MVGVIQVKLELSNRRTADLSVTTPSQAERSGEPDLVNSGNNGSVRQDLVLQFLLGEVRDAYGLDFSGLEQIFHLLPGIFEFPVEQNVTARPIREGGEIRVVPVWIKGDLRSRTRSSITRSVGFCRCTRWQRDGSSPANGSNTDQYNRHRGFLEWNLDTPEHADGMCS